MNLVTGGAGFLGSHLVEQLLADGEPVRVLERPGAAIEHLPLARIELVTADIRDDTAVRDAAKGCRRVYHLAADPNLWRRDRHEFDAINHIGTLNVVRAALDHGAERVLHTSTESILTSRQSKGGPVEHLRLHESVMIGPYCRSKFRAEAEVLKFADAGAPVVLCSPTLPIGPGDWLQTPPTRMAVTFCRGRLYAYLDCKMNLVDARDVATGMIRVMERGRPGVRYVLGGHNLRLADWLRLLGAAIGAQAPRFTVPYALALGVAWMSERWADFVTGRIPLATVTGVRLTRRNMFFDPAASLAELDLCPRPVEESIRDAVAWYRAQGWIDP